LTIYGELRMLEEGPRMASLNVNMPDDMRAALDEAAREEKFATPTEFARHIIREYLAQRERRRIVAILREGLGDEHYGADHDDFMDSLRRRLDTARTQARKRRSPR
jgi:Arc/MetJ-type ribon-helix-helix transcriptional regulator